MKIKINAKCKGHEPKDRSYIDDSHYADYQLARGIKQVRCPICKLWIWPNEFFRSHKTAKKRTVTVKAWAFIGATNKAVCVSTTQPFCVSVPCVAHIKASEYVKLKGVK